MALSDGIMCAIFAWLFVIVAAISTVLAAIKGAMMGELASYGILVGVGFFILVHFAKDRPRYPWEAERKPIRKPRPLVNPRKAEMLAGIVVDCAGKLHADAGPGLKKDTYAATLARMLEDRGLGVVRGALVEVEIMGQDSDERLRADLIVEDTLPLEVGSSAAPDASNTQHMRSLLRHLKMPLGLVVNFGTPAFDDVVTRITNDPT